MDYGLVAAASGRIQAGESPYVDFLTPIQAGFLQLNSWVETLLGGGFLGLTRGGALLIVVTFGSFAALLGRAWPRWFAIVLASAITILAASQHTIIWHNTLGVFAMGVAVCSAALNPIWRRSHFAMAAVTAVALWLGGINKLNYQIVAIAGVAGFALRARFLKKASVAETGVTMIGILVAGVIAPMATELWSTGAGLREWYENVIALSSGSRAHYLEALVSWQYYLRPYHDYYGPIFPSAFGLLFAIFMTGAVAILWRSRSNLDRALLVLAGAGVLAAGLAILATNHEIAFVSAAAMLVLSIAVGLGFGCAERNRVYGSFWAVTFAVIWTQAGWLSAWEGQRSQFGHSSSSRETYREIHPSFDELAYVDGVRFPPEIAESYESLASWMKQSERNRSLPLFYGTGLEWLEQVWPQPKVARLPLWLHDKTSYQREQDRQLYELLVPPPAFSAVVEAVPWAFWPGQSQTAVSLMSQMEYRGPFIRLRHMEEQIFDSRLPVEAITTLGMNMDPQHLQLDSHPTVVPRQRTDKMVFLSSLSDSWDLTTDWPGRTGRVTAVLQNDPTLAGAEGTFSVESFVDGDWQLEQSQRLSVAIGEHDGSAEVEFRARSRKLRFSFRGDQNNPSAVFGGWRGFIVLGTSESEDDPPSLFGLNEAQLADTPIPTSLNHEADFPYARSRGAVVIEDSVTLQPEDEYWVKSDSIFEALPGSVRFDLVSGSHNAELTILWVKGGRIQILNTLKLTADTNAHAFSLRSPGPGGWLGFVLNVPPSSGISASISFDP